MKDEPLEHSVIYLHNQGWSIRALSKSLCISRERVRNILKRNEYRRSNGKEYISKRSRSSMLDPYKEYIGEILEQYKKTPPTNQRIFELIREKGYSGGITILSNYLSKIKAPAKKEAIICVETKPGQRASHDWSDYFIEFSREGQSRKITFFSIVLNYSRRQYIEIVKDKTQAVLFECLVNSFSYFEGVPQEIKSDNQKACVDRWEQGRPVFNSKLLSFASHYRFRPLAIHPGKPTENLKVERPFYYLETNFLNARSFYDVDDLKQQLYHWLTRVNDQRIHKRTGKKPIDMYSEELPYLQSLPKAHYDTSVIEARIVNNESCIRWQNYYYVVPQKYMYETCQVREKDDELIIYSPDFLEIKRYKLASPGSKDKYIGRENKTTSKEHHLPNKLVVERLASFGPLMQQYINQVSHEKPNTFRHHLQHILSLKVHYQVDDILRAVKRAINYKVYESGAIENFLITNAKKKTEY